MTWIADVARRKTLRTHVIDGEPIRLYVDRLTVAELDHVALIGVGRGTKTTNADVSEMTQKQAKAIDKFVSVFPGDVLVDGEAVTSVGVLFGGQTTTLDELFGLLLRCQSLTPEESHDMTVAIRFTQWLYAKDRKKSHWVDTGTSCALCHAMDLCKKRACGTTPSTRPVWNDNAIYVKRCPILSLTQEVERVIRLFEWTHSWTDNGYKQTCLPGPAALDEQEAWTLSALAHTRNVFTKVSLEQMKRTHGRN